MAKTKCTVWSHDRCRIVEKEWKALTFIGVQLDDADNDGTVRRYELRNCQKCGSTLAREIVAEEKK